jgi:hypothetical protein
MPNKSIVTIAAAIDIDKNWLSVVGLDRRGAIPIRKRADDQLTNETPVLAGNQR